MCQSVLLYKAINCRPSDDFCCKWSNVEVNSCNIEQNLFFIKSGLPSKDSKCYLQSIICLPVHFLFTMKCYQLFEAADGSIVLTTINQHGTKIFVYKFAYDSIHAMCSFDTFCSLFDRSPTLPTLYSVSRLDEHLLLNTAYKNENPNDRSYTLIVQHLINLDNNFTQRGIPLIFIRLPQSDPSCMISFDNQLKGLFLISHDSHQTTFFEITDSFRCELAYQLQRLEYNALSTMPSHSSLNSLCWSLTLPSEESRPRRRCLTSHFSRDSGYASLSNAFSECNVNFPTHRSQPQSYGSISSFRETINFKSHPNLSLSRMQPHRIKVLPSSTFGCFGSRRQDFKEPNGIVVLPDETLVVSDGNDQSIKFFTPNGGFLHSWPIFVEFACNGYPNCIAFLEPTLDFSRSNFCTMLFDRSPMPNLDWGLVVVLRKPTPCVQLYTLGGYKIRDFGFDLTNPKAITTDRIRRRIIVVESNVSCCLLIY
ncbi:hypothetical protein Ciccas_000298 [Cichlidogyrus casuarinus]|uniref:Uncharacterized protein n=1 Tax=Cichlidogyrus casuarinus TaxID=1844966 RepID=A0ABD2QNK2_9PLAT